MVRRGWFSCYGWFGFILYAWFRFILYLEESFFWIKQLLPLKRFSSKMISLHQKNLTQSTPHPFQKNSDPKLPTTPSKSISSTPPVPGVSAIETNKMDQETAQKTAPTAKVATMVDDAQSVDTDIQEKNGEIMDSLPVGAVAVTNGKR